MSDPVEKLLKSRISAAISLGWTHKDEDGNVLATPIEVINVMLKGQRVKSIPPEGIDIYEAGWCPNHVALTPDGKLWVPHKIRLRDIPVSRCG